MFSKTKFWDQIEGKEDFHHIIRKPAACVTLSNINMMTV